MWVTNKLLNTCNNVNKIVNSNQMPIVIDYTYMLLYLEQGVKS